MDSKQLFQKYYSRLAKEGVIKALILSAIAGFAASIISAVVILFVKYDVVWIICVSIGIGLVLTAAATPLCYRMFFRPTTKQIAERIDRLGLDERLITMMELERDESFIAMRQREDAKTKLGMVNRELLKVSLSKIPLIVLLVISLCSLSAITVSAIAVAPMKGWKDPSTITQPLPEYSYVSVYYVVDTSRGGQGFIDENATQIVVYGGDALTVTAVPAPGYGFLRWSDGVRTATRTDMNIRADLTVAAIFAEVRDGDGPGSGDRPGQPDPNGEPGNGGMPYEEINFFIDGKTWYIDEFDKYYEEAMELLIAGGDIPAYLKNIISLYFDII